MRRLRYIRRTLLILPLALLAALSLLCLGLYVKSLDPSCWRQPMYSSLIMASGPAPDIGRFPVAPGWRLHLPGDLLPDRGRIHFSLLHMVPAERWLNQAIYPNCPVLTDIRGGRLHFQDGSSSTGRGALLDIRNNPTWFGTVEFHSQIVVNADPQNSCYIYSFVIPLLPAAALLGILPAFVLAFILARSAWRRIWRRMNPGACRECGYDLTGNVSGICPECGTVVSGQ